ncbi:LysR family transcriptional regulator [Variovorax sp. WS11]|uniref:LysR family transcriptional regulator n=1 Tax=Variovorax sp. WS11 TaxID=1105204 RepID=UPI000D0CB7F6|nr:LysR family transcriptional regulator [Variovorax sp. WS11]NDZ18464.1 LysR family transcriptional regulator [Variovorax sp. WS11]PSL85110.1 LysR family transcriptional regulator [Variovorax sp. WS11]
MKPNYTVAPGALEGVEAFLRVAERRSFRQAADDLGITPSAISQTIRGLEARVGVALFTRTTRNVGLTEAGERFLEHARPAFEEMVAAADAARGLAQRPSGLLRLAAPRAVVPLLLQPVLASFTQAYPEVVVEIAASEELVDLAKDGFDAGIRLGEFIAADMTVVRLTPALRYAIVASPDYLSRRGIPKVPEDLHAHSCVRMRRSSGALAPWRVEDGGRSLELVVNGPLVVNDFPTMLGAALSGVGLAQVPEPIAVEHVIAGRLQEVLSTCASTTPGVFLYHSGRRQVLPKLRAFIDHIRR